MNSPGRRRNPDSPTNGDRESDLLARGGEDRGSSRPRTTERILAYIEKVQAAQGAPPTLREIGLTFGIRSTNGVTYHLDRLEREGWIRRRPHLARGIAVRTDGPAGRADALADQADVLAGRREGGRGQAGEEARDRLRTPGPEASIPILGRIAAGGPVSAEENREGELDPGRLGELRPDFALRVTGDSMRDAGILEGDLVLIRTRSDPRDGEIVVACIGDETTVKRFFRREGEIVLRPENPAYAPIRVTPDSPELRILGIVVGVYREFPAAGGARRRRGA